MTVKVDFYWVIKKVMTHFYIENHRYDMTFLTACIENLSHSSMKLNLIDFANLFKTNSQL